MAYASTMPLNHKVCFDFLKEWDFLMFFVFFRLEWWRFSSRNDHQTSIEQCPSPSWNLFTRLLCYFPRFRRWWLNFVGLFVFLSFIKYWVNREIKVYFIYPKEKKMKLTAFVKSKVMEMIIDTVIDQIAVAAFWIFSICCGTKNKIGRVLLFPTLLRDMTKLFGFRGKMRNWTTI